MNVTQKSTEGVCQGHLHRLIEMLRTLLQRSVGKQSCTIILEGCTECSPLLSLASFSSGFRSQDPLEHWQKYTNSLSSQQRQENGWAQAWQGTQATPNWQAGQPSQYGLGRSLTMRTPQPNCRLQSNLLPRNFSSVPVELGRSSEEVESRELQYGTELQRVQEEEDEEDTLRRVDLPLIHPKASVTSEHHPCGAEHLEFPFSAKAFYIGKGYKEQISKLKQAAADQGWQTEYTAGSQIMCLRETSQPLNDEEDYTGLPCETYIMPLDRMDSVIFFNAGGQEREIWERNTGAQLTSRFIEETKVTVMPDLERHSMLFSDLVVLQQADLNRLRTIAFVLGQTVSLHYYEMQVDHMLRTFKDMNKEMRRTGSFKPVATKEELLQMVAQNNLLFTDIISKLGIMERFDVAWKNSNCNDIYEHLRVDMEIENRNSNLQVKLHLVSENVKYLLELMQNQKSDFLEWIIIILIGAEIMVSLFDMFHKFN